MKKTILLFSATVGFILGSALCLLAQDDTKTRSITSDDFSSQCPVSKSNIPPNTRKKQTVAPTKRRTTYKYVRQDKNAVRRKNTTPKIQPKTQPKPEKVSEIGVTMWKLRPSRPSDNGYNLPVLVNSVREPWTAERIDPATAFKAGDRVRLAIESSASGYLYVIDSEIYANGTYGEPFLIFPESGEDNSVQPGLLVDIPDQTEDLPYFLMNPKQSGYKGELLTVIISPKPLTNLKTDADGKIKNLEDLIDLEETSDAEIFSRTDNQDKIYANSEANAACGGKTRQLEREKSTENPCGKKTRQLTREEPLPQTIYRVKTVTGQPAVAFIRLNVGN